MPSKLSKNPEVRKAQMRRRHEKRRQRIRTDPEYRMRHNRKRSLRAKYDLSLEDFEVFKEAHDNKCAICGLGPGPNQQNLDIDHNHKTLYIRGLLCRECNTGIGKFKEDVRLLQKAIDYLTERGSIHEQ